jgi:hypothetical protein
MKFSAPVATEILFMVMFRWMSLEMRAMILLESSIFSSADDPNMMSGLPISPEDAG